MNAPRKTWVIPDSPSRPGTPLRPGRDATIRVRGSFRPKVLRGREAAPPPPAPRPPESKWPGLVLFLVPYLFGPFSLLGLRRGPYAAGWCLLGATTGTAAALVVWQRPLFLETFQGGELLTLVAVAAALATIALAFLSWSRAVYLAGRELAGRRGRFPGWTQAPFTAGVLGVLLPGAGLLLAGRPRRAAWSVLWVGVLCVCAGVLAHAGWLWSWWMGTFGVDGSGLELEAVFAAAALGVVLAGCAWIVQALDGARLVHPGAGKRSDLVSLALLATLAFFPVAFRPGLLAANLSDLALALRVEGLRAIPLGMAVAAHELDPSRPVYALRAADLYEDLGRTRDAETLRAGVEERWQAYALEMKRLESEREAGSAPPPPAPVHSGVYWSQGSDVRPPVPSPWGAAESAALTTSVGSGGRPLPATPRAVSASARP